MSGGSTLYRAQDWWENLEGPVPSPEALIYRVHGDIKEKI
jgi:hypothetical protein